ncbi:MAG: MerR family transcriptional regulator [Acidobacteriaceae bacterium]|nr:MerR family transcriptional regulator [Acidobacteriaceae bacterium]
MPQQGRKALPDCDPEVRYGARAFAVLAGVTVRTLHHYDRVGLLKAKRSGSGYRLYRAQDLERLEQIAALKFLGLPLARIRKLLESGPVSLEEELARQGRALREKRRLLGAALSAIEDAESGIREGRPAGELLRRIIEAMDMQNNVEWMMRYYSPEAQARIAERAATFTPEKQKEISEAWKQYYHDLDALKREEDPGGAKAEDLARRHKELVAAFTGGDPEVEAGLKALYKDRENWPEEMRARAAEFEKGEGD